MSDILKIFLGAPAWVYVIFVYLIIIGVMALQDTVIGLVKVTIVPVVFITWSIYSIFAKYGFSPSLFGLWILFFSIGAFIGWSILSRDITVNKKDMLVHIPGSIYPLILYMTFFLVKYAIGATSAMKPELTSNFIIWGTDLIASGLISGIFTGRFLNILQKYYQPK